MEINNQLILENSRNLNILYVEDNEELRINTAQLFESFFASVTVATDGYDGLEKYKKYIEENDEIYDIVVSDINMPNMSGIEMVESIREINYEQTIIFITAFNEPEYLHFAINIGARGFISKPIQIKELRKVLYSTCQFIVDNKIMLNYYEQIEEKNMLHINQKDASNFNAGLDILDDLVNHKILISKIWTDVQIVHDRLALHQIDVEYFRTHFGIKVVEYFLNVIKGDEEMGNCPVVFIMLDFFKNKNLPLEDIFMVCVHFKNTITSYILDRYSFNHKLYDDISKILDSNFEGVIINYLKLKYTEPIKEIENIIIEEKSIKKVSTVIEEENINYIEYVLDHDLYELQDLEDDIDSLAISVTQNNKTSIKEFNLLGSKIKRYGNILNNYPIFSELGKYIYKLGLNLSDNAQLLYDDNERMLNISALIEGFVNDLIVWRKEIFENNIKDPHFLNQSFFSNVDTIIMFIEYDENQEAESFDDDMFF